MGLMIKIIDRASVLGEQSIGLWITKHLINHNKASN